MIFLLFSYKIVVKINLYFILEDSRIRFKLNVFGINLNKE